MGNIAVRTRSGTRSWPSVPERVPRSRPTQAGAENLDQQAQVLNRE